MVEIEYIKSKKLLNRMIQEDKMKRINKEIKSFVEEEFETKKLYRIW